MSAIPTRRLFVYIAAGLVVLVVGTLGVVSMRGGSAASADGVTILAGDPNTVAIAAGSPGLSAATTSTTQTPVIYVQVVGAVRRPGVYQVAPDARVFQAVVQAGGFTDEADQQSIALAARLTDGCRVYVPRVGEPAVDPVVSPAQQAEGAGEAATGPVSLNTATLAQLDSLPGIGPAIAQDIIAYREARGPFTSIDQLTDVPGIGPAKLEKLRPLVGL
ncbi:MAG: helix-hairpin-helix domain-containing protein [bacterium]